MTASGTGREDHGVGEAAGTPPRRRRRAVGPPGAHPAGPDGAGPGWSAQSDPPEDDDERFLRDVPPHHGR